MLERRDIRKWRGIDCENFFQVQTNILVYQVNSDVYKLKSTSTNLCCYSWVKKLRGRKFSTLWLLHFFLLFWSSTWEISLSSLTPERSGIVELTIIGKIGTRTRVTSFTEDYTIADSNLYTWFCFGFYRILVRPRVGWSKYLFLANEWKKKHFVNENFESQWPLFVV